MLGNLSKFESKIVEYKEEVNHKNYEKWAKTVVAFANTDGGSIYFGVNDDGELIGLEPDILKKEIPYINTVCDKNISPRIKYDFNETETNNGKYILEMRIPKAIKTPVWLTRSDEEEVVYVRREGESVIAHGEEIEELILRGRNISFDSLLSNYQYEDLSFNVLNRKYQERNKTDNIITKKLLQSKGALTSDDIATNALLLFSDDIHELDNKVVCRIWPGSNKASMTMIDKKTFQGNIIDCLEFAQNFVNLYVKQGLVKLNSGGNSEITSYPQRAIEEALINAFAHRDYYISGSQIDVDIFVDRIQITSPGKFILPGRAQDYDMRYIPSRQRNAIICELFSLCRLMETSGSGLELIADLYDSFPEEYKPEIYSDPAQFIIVLKDLTYSVEDKEDDTKELRISFKSPRSGNREYDKKILMFCLDNPKSRQEIQDFIELSDKKHFVNSILNPLLDSELLIPTQEYAKSPNQKYYTNKNKIRFI